jgi:uncharacterized protein YdeI (YjbR/CyaY-like superfamily)
MGKKDPGVDAYIGKSADFAKPILNHIRKIIHDTCPDVKEEVKWRMPNFLHYGIMCNMAAFKEHCAFGFWKGKLIFGDKYSDGEEEAMGSFGRITKISDLPPDKILIGYIKKAMKLNEEGVKAPAVRKGREKAGLAVPSYFMDALKKNKKAFATFESFSPGNKRDYIEWITEAKTEETRKKRLETAIEWMAEGKIRNWKYVKK